MSNIDDTYETWRNSRTPGNMHAVLKVMAGDIDRAIQTAGGKPSPLTRGLAKNIVVEAVNTFDPKAGTQFRSWTQSKLRSLVRPIRSTRFTVKIPEARARESARVRSYIDSIQSETGFEPSDEIIADALAIPMNRVNQARVGISPEVVGDEIWARPEAADNTALIHDMVYTDLDPISQTIFEYTFGYNGVKPEPSTEIARRLKISPSAVSQRLSKINTVMSEAEEGLE